MPETTLSFAKIVATPTSTSWSQSYNAGSLFVVLSLTGDVSSEEGQTLNGLGKEFINTLEAEFFTLEEKSLSAIKQALTDSQAKIPSIVTLSIAMVFIKQNIVYGYAIGFGKIILRRAGQIGTILTNKESSSASPRDIATSSGILKPKDTIVLQTKQFASAITPEVLKQALELDIPNDIAETLSVPIHGTDEGAAAGIVLTFHGASQTYVVEQKKENSETTPVQESAETTPAPPISEPLAPAPLTETPATEPVVEATPPVEAAETPLANTPAQPTAPEVTTPEIPETVAPPSPTTTPSQTAAAYATSSSPAATPISEASAIISPPPTPLPPPTEVPVSAPLDQGLPIQPEAIPVEEPVILEPSKFAFLSTLVTKIPHPSITLTRRHKIGIVILIVLLLVLGIGIYFATRSEKTVVDTELFNKVYPEAQKDYEEGEGLLSLNKNLARDDFLAAQKKLQSLQGKYAKDSKEDKAVLELLSKVETKLKGASGIKQAETTEITDDKDAVLAYAKKNANTPLTQDDSFIYAATAKAVVRIDKGNNDDKSIITNDDDWENVKGVGVYLSNIYLLDTKNAVLKFVPSGADYSSPSSYFPKDATPDTSKAISMSIDGSIWLLFSDGTISKYTKGVSDSFKVIGIDTPFSKPTKIVTNADMTNLYILDNGNNRIVTIDKKGNYQAQIVSETLASATEMTIDEKNKKARFLSSGKIYEMSL